MGPSVLARRRTVPQHRLGTLNAVSRVVSGMKLLSLAIAVIAAVGVAYVAIAIPAQSEVVSAHSHR